MNPLTKLAVAAVIGVVAVAGALMVIRGPSGPGGRSTPTPPPPTVIGTWDAEFTREEMVAAGLADALEDNAGNYGHFRLTFAAQSFQLVQLTAPNERGNGTFSIAGTTITLSWQSGDGETFSMPFTVTDTLLTFGSGGPVTFRVEPWVRVSAASSQPGPSPTSKPPRTLTTAYVGVTLEAATYEVFGFATPFTVTLPAGWQVAQFTHNDIVLRNENAFLTLVVVPQIYPDPCHTESDPTTIGPSVDDLVSALSSMTGFSVTGIEDATVGGATGKSFTLSNSIDLVANQCTSSEVLWIGRDGDDVPVLEGAPASEALWAVDASGTTVLIGGPTELIDTISFGATSN